MEHETYAGFLAKRMQETLDNPSIRHWFYADDIKDYETIIQLLRENKGKEAAKKILSLDTIIRDTIPDSVYIWAVEVAHDLW